MEKNDAFVIHAFWNETFSKHTGAHNRLVIDAVTLLTLVAEMLWTDTLLIQKRLNYTFWKHVVAHDRLVIDTVIILTLVEEMKWIDAFVTHVFSKNTC